MTGPFPEVMRPAGRVPFAASRRRACGSQAGSAVAGPAGKRRAAAVAGPGGKRRAAAVAGLTAGVGSRRLRRVGAVVSLRRGCAEAVRQWLLPQWLLPQRLWRGRRRLPGLPRPSPRRSPRSPLLLSLLSRRVSSSCRAKEEQQAVSGSCRDAGELWGWWSSEPLRPCLCGWRAGETPFGSTEGCGGNAYRSDRLLEDCLQLSHAVTGSKLPSCGISGQKAAELPPARRRCEPGGALDS